MLQSRHSQVRLVSEEQKRQTSGVDETKHPTEFPIPVEDIIFGLTGSFSVEDEEHFSSVKYDPAEVPEINSCSLSLFQKRPAVLTLLRHAARGEFNEVDAMLSKNPLLLKEKGTIIDFCGRKHLDCTVYQFVLGAKDKNVKNAKGDKIVVHGMIEMIEEKHFPELKKHGIDYETEMQKQFDEQYPAEYKEIEAKEDARDDAAYDAALNVVKKASNVVCESTNTLEDEIHEIRRKEESPRADELRSITRSIYKAETQETFEIAFAALKGYLCKEGLIKSDSFDFTVLEAIYRFRNHWETKKPTIVKDHTIGKHFNHKAAVKSGNEYDTNYEAFGAGRDDKWNAPKNILCWQKLVGYIDRFVPACDAEVISQGAYYVLEEGELCRRTLDWRYGGGRYFPLDSDPAWEIGHNCRPRFAGRAGCGAAFAFYKTYVEQKLRPLVVMQRRDNPSRSSACVIL